MAYPAFVTSDVVDAATVAAGTSTATELTTGERVLTYLVIDNSSNQALELFFERASAPTGAVSPDYVVLAGRIVTIDLKIMGRAINPTIYGRVKSAATGSITINALN